MNVQIYRPINPELTLGVKGVPELESYITAHKIRVIKAVRYLTGLGLKETQEWVNGVNRMKFDSHVDLTYMRSALTLIGEAYLVGQQTGSQGY